LRSISRSALPALLAALAASAWGAAPRKAATSKAAKVPRPAAETVYVQVTPPREKPAPAVPAAQAAAPRAPERSFSGPARDYGQAYGMYLGVYNAEVLGSNPFATLYWDLYPRGEAYFFEFTAGGGTVQSDFSRSVLGADEFEHNWLVALEALMGYSYSGLFRGTGRGAGLFPYFVAGITAVYQGGVPNVGAVAGFGNRMILPFGPKNGRWALNYGLRDHIYSQKIRNEPSLTQNFVILIGTQKYF
jgi:hypothetical protein